MEQQDRIVSLTDLFVHWIEIVAAVLLALLAAASVVALVVEMVLAARHPSPDAISSLFGAILLVFILLELYGIGAAFIKGLDVADKVFEVGLVALIRQVIVAEFLHLTTPQLLTIAALVLALGVSWFLSRRAEAQPHGHSRS